MKRRWNVAPTNGKLQSYLSRELKISRITSQILINRGLVECNMAFSFLSPTLKDLHDPFLMKDMDRAVDRIVSAIRNKEKIVIYGDYDVDGITSTAMMFLFLKTLGGDVDFYIPERLKEGYGLNVTALEGLVKRGANLLITVDCGVSNFDEVVHGRALGLDIIITDHHEISNRIPPALAVVNPKQAECAFPFKELAGVGVAFNLVMALRARLRDKGFLRGEPPNIKRYLDLTALGTIADMVPLVGENRILTKFGLEEISNTSRYGIQFLKEVCGLKNTRVKAGHVSFQISPRINAMGRLGRAELVVRLLATDDENVAKELSFVLDKVNTLRQAKEEQILIEAIRMIESDSGFIDNGNIRDNGIVLYSNKWHPGVIGIVASKLVERYNRPVILIAVEDEICKGSARSIKGYNILEGLKGCNNLLEKFGGHKVAAGLLIKAENIESFKEFFLDFANRSLDDTSLVPEISIDAIISLDELDPPLVHEIEALAPFGPLNAEPVLAARDTHILYTNVVGNRHLKLKLREKGGVWDAIGYGLGNRHPVKGYGFDIAFSPYIDEWKGVRSLKLRIKELNRFQ